MEKLVHLISLQIVNPVHHVEHQKSCRKKNPSHFVKFENLVSFRFYVVSIGTRPGADFVVFLHQLFDQLCHLVVVLI